MTQGKRTRPLLEPPPDPIDRFHNDYVDDVTVVPNDKITNPKPWLFQPGNPGGPGRPHMPTLTEVLRKHAPPVELAAALLTMALTDGHRDQFPALQYIYNRLDGMPKQALELASAEDDPAVLAMATLAASYRAMLAGANPLYIEGAAPQTEPAPTLIEAPIDPAP